MTRTAIKDVETEPECPFEEEPDDSNEASESKPEPPPPPKTIKEFLRYDFTEAEMKQKADELSLALQRKERAEQDQKAAQAQFKERIEAQTNIISRVSREYQAGYEFRDIECRVDFHTPTVAVKRITRLDSGEIVRECAMLASELQDNLFEPK